MATKKFYHDIDLGQVGQLVGGRIENVTSTELVTLAGSLGAANRGYMVYDTTAGKINTWNGSAFDEFAVEVTGDISFKGIINPTSSSSVTPVSGNQYVVDSAGSLSTQGGAITYSPSANVEVGDVVLFTSATTASVMERNLEKATETTLGTISLSSQGEVDAGVVADEAVTPATLHGYVNPEFSADRARLTANEGDIASLQTFSGEGTGLDTVAVDLAAAVNELHGEIGSNDSDIASLQSFSGEGTALTTTATDLAAAVNELDSDIAAEAARAAAEEATLQGNIDSEETARIAADSGLQSNIDTEEAARIAADNGLQSNIDTEESARIAADNSLQSNIDTEEAARIAADSALDTRVTAVEARDEVYTYAASVDLTADTALTVSHNLSLSNQNSFVFNAMHGDQQISLQVGSVDANSIEVTSSP